MPRVKRVTSGKFHFARTTPHRRSDSSGKMKFPRPDPTARAFCFRLVFPASRGYKCLFRNGLSDVARAVGMTLLLSAPLPP